MNKLSPKFALSAGIPIIAAALFPVGVIARKYFSGNNSSTNPPEDDLPAHPKTPISVLRKDCRLRTESASFRKKRLQQENTHKLIAVLPGNIEESSAYLNQLGISNIEAQRSPLSKLQTSGTPALILTGDKVEVTNFRIGKLPADKEDEVIKQLKS